MSSFKDRLRALADAAIDITIGLAKLAAAAAMLIAAAACIILAVLTSPTFFGAIGFGELGIFVGGASAVPAASGFTDLGNAFKNILTALTPGNDKLSKLKNGLDGKGDNFAKISDWIDSKISMISEHFSGNGHKNTASASKM